MDKMCPSCGQACSGKRCPACGAKTTPLTKGYGAFVSEARYTDWLNDRGLDRLDKAFPPEPKGDKPVSTKAHHRVKGKVVDAIKPGTSLDDEGPEDTTTCPAGKHKGPVVKQ